MSNNNFLDATAVANFMGTSVSTAYKVIRRLNEELNDSGYVTIAGKVNKKYFESKIYGLNNQVSMTNGANYAGL